MMSGVLADKSEARGSERESECVVETCFFMDYYTGARTDLPLIIRYAHIPPA